MDASRGHESTTGHDANRQTRFSYTLDTSGWPGENNAGSSGVPISEMGEEIKHLDGTKRFVEIV